MPDCAPRVITLPISPMKSAPLHPNSSCATSQGSRSSGGPNLRGSGGCSRRARRSRRRTVKYSGWRARQPAWVRRRNSARQAWLQERWRLPTRRSGWNHFRHTEHGFFLLMVMPHGRHYTTIAARLSHASVPSVLVGHFCRAGVGLFSRALKFNGAVNCRISLFM